MEDIYSTIQYKGKDYKIVFNLNVMEKIQEAFGSVDAWSALMMEKEEPDAKAVIVGFREMLNEGIDIDNEENGTNEPLLTHKQAGRMISGLGLAKTAEAITDTVIESSKGEEKNASSTKKKK